MYESASERLLWSFWPVCSIDFERVRICLRRKSVWVPIFTNKRDVESCGNYWGIKMWRWSFDKGYWRLHSGQKWVFVRSNMVTSQRVPQLYYLPWEYWTRTGQKKLHCDFKNVSLWQGSRESLWYSMSTTGGADNDDRLEQHMTCLKAVQKWWGLRWICPRDQFWAPSCLQ